MAEIIKQTAVEWFLIECGKYGDTAQIPDQVIEQAKEMEIHQILNAYTEGVEEENKMDVFNDHPQHWACEYSHRTYGNIYGREK